MRWGLSAGLLVVVAVASVIAAAAGPDVSLSEQPLLAIGGWSIAMLAALVAAGLSLEPRPEGGLAAVSPLVGGLCGVGVVAMVPHAWGVVCAAFPLAWCLFLRASSELREAVSEAPTELWETAWLLGATRLQTVVHVVVPSAVGLRARMVRVGAEALAGALLVFLVSVGVA
jgi:ABC-type molybdate transport system permease subunit